MFILWLTFLQLNQCLCTQIPLTCKCVRWEYIDGCEKINSKESSYRTNPCRQWAGMLQVDKYTLLMSHRHMNLHVYTTRVHTTHVHTKIDRTHSCTHSNARTTHVHTAYVHNNHVHTTHVDTQQGQKVARWRTSLSLSLVFPSLPHLPHLYAGCRTCLPPLLGVWLIPLATGCKIRGTKLLFEVTAFVRILLILAFSDKGTTDMAAVFKCLLCFTRTILQKFRVSTWCKESKPVRWE